VAAEPEELARRSSRLWRQLRTNPGFWIGLICVAVLVVAALAAPWLAARDPIVSIRGTGLSATGAPMGPSAEFWFGTDRLGRDYFSRMLHGARTSLTVALGANLAAAIIGTAVGAVAAYAGTPRLGLRFGRRQFTLAIPAEALLMRVTDALLALPAILFAIALAAVLGPSLLLLFAIIAALLWTTTARIVFNQVRVVLARDFIEAARAIGVRGSRILWRHVIPHVIPVMVVYTTLGIAVVILFEATLSFLGVGVPPPAPSWGSMIAEHATYYRTDPRLLLLPGGAIAVSVLAFSLLGDAVRDALDPRLTAGPIG